MVERRCRKPFSGNLCCANGYLSPPFAPCGERGRIQSQFHFEDAQFSPFSFFLSFGTRTGRWPLWLRGEPSWQAIQGTYATQRNMSGIQPTLISYCLHRHKESPSSTSSIGLKKLLSAQILVRYSWKDISFLIAGVVHASAYCSRLFSSCLSSFKVHDFTLRCTCAF